eukprot:tig00021728_g23306.t1
MVPAAATTVGAADGGQLQTPALALQSFREDPPAPGLALAAAGEAELEDMDDGDDAPPRPAPPPLNAACPPALAAAAAPAAALQLHGSSRVRLVLPDPAELEDEPLEPPPAAGDEEAAGARRLSSLSAASSSCTAAAAAAAGAAASGRSFGVSLRVPDSRASLGSASQGGGALRTRAALLALEARAYLREALSTPARTVRAAAAAAPAAARQGWRNLAALLLIMAGPVAAIVPIFAIPFDEIRSHVARASLFVFLVTAGVGTNAGVWFSVTSEVPVFALMPSWVLVYAGLSTALFAIVNAGVDMSTLPFGYVVGVGCAIVAMQVNTRVHAAFLRRRRARAHPSDPAPRAAAPASASGLLVAVDLPTSPEPPLTPKFDERGIPRLWNRYARAKHALDQLPLLYLFMFGLVKSPLGQIAINFAATFLSLAILWLQVRYYGREMYDVMPHGDAVVLYILGNLLNQRIFRQLCYFQVKSPIVYVVSLAFELASLLFPASMLVDRLGRPALARMR